VQGPARRGLADARLDTRSRLPDRAPGGATKVSQVRQPPRPGGVHTAN
jgi:hypothetical protein